MSKLKLESRNFIVIEKMSLFERREVIDVFKENKAMGTEVSDNVLLRTYCLIYSPNVFMGHYMQLGERDSNLHQRGVERFMPKPPPVVEYSKQIDPLVINSLVAVLASAQAVVTRLTKLINLLEEQHGNTDRSDS